MSTKNAPAVVPAVLDPNRSSGTSPTIAVRRSPATSHPNKFAHLADGTVVTQQAVAA